ncbi:ABC transporter substrate-binding protein [Aureimonas psammosilenae]|uniref:ABC transporter substrate-binding protein n=1 Tax=Aureimonas psammosilenae TaxID=2495496 RepID=UPI0012610765|nr:ABC transporter substrate-binding protein [Aureimonas psammosilenae]
MRIACLLTAFSVTLLSSTVWAQTDAPQRGGVIDVATIGEPPTLDPMASTADLVGIVSQHIFETLYTFGSDWSVVPLLAETLPEISDGGRVYTIKLRQGITFHDGSAMDSADVLASLKRWQATASRGQQAAKHIASIEAVDPATVRITLKEPFAPLLSLLAFNNSAAVVLPEENAAVPMEKPVGTGPYKLGERRPDQYIQLLRFGGYKPRGDAANGYGGARHQYLDEIRFVPVPDPNTRVEGAVAGQFAYADSIPVESVGRLEGGKTEAVTLRPFGWPVFVMNTKQGLLSDVAKRRAVLTALNPEDLLIAGFGSADFYAVDGSLYPEGYNWHSGEGVSAYGKGDPEEAAAALKAAGYDGATPLRILTSRQYEFHYKMAEVAAEYLRQAGLQVQLDVVDWATLTQRRQDPALWDIFISHSPFLPEPSLIGVMQDSSPGWWVSDAKTKALEAFNRESDPAKRAALFGDVQKVFYDEVPAFKVGDFNAVAAKSPALHDVTPAPWPYFWNAWLSR